MFASLRNRLIISHVLPVLLIIPLTGVAMAYVLETRLLLPMVYNSLADDATLMAAITGDQPLFWENPTLAQSLVDGVEPHLSGQVSVISLDGRVLARTNLPSGSRAQLVELPDLRGVGRGQTVQLRQGPLAEAYAPAFDVRHWRSPVHLGLTLGLRSATPHLRRSRTPCSSSQSSRCLKSGRMDLTLPQNLFEWFRWCRCTNSCTTT